MLISLSKNLEKKIYYWADSFSSLPNFHLRLAALCTFLVFVTGGDALVSLMVGFEKLSENTTWQFLKQQADSPLTARSGRELFHHTSKMVHRLFPPLLGKLCVECSLKGFMYFLILMEYLAGFLFFLVFGKFISKISTPSVSFLLTVSICFIFLGKLFFWDATDGFALLGLLVAMQTRRRDVLFIALCVAYWTDERAIIASGLLFFWHGILHRKDTDLPLNVSELFQFNKLQKVIVCTLLFHFTIRILLARIYSMPPTITLSQALAEMKIVLIKNRSLELIPLVTFTAFEGWWLILVSSMLAIGRLVDKWVFTLYVICFAALLLVSYMVMDMTRSMVYAFPAVLIAFYWLLLLVSIREIRRLLVIVLLFNLLYPTYYLGHYVWPFFMRTLKYALIYGL